MPATSLILAALALVYVAASAATTRFLLRREDLSAESRRAQVVAVWLLPILGACLFWLLNRAYDDRPVRVRRSTAVDSVDSGPIDALD